MHKYRFKLSIELDLIIESCFIVNVKNDDYFQILIRTPGSPFCCRDRCYSHRRLGGLEI